MGAEVQTDTSEWRQFYKFAVAKAMESCLGKDTVNKYTVNMKKAVAKCQQEEAPELDLPPYRSMYKFVNTIIKSADQMDQFKMKMMFHTMRQMSNNYNYDHYNNKHNSESNWLQEQFRKYQMHKMMKKMMHGNFDDSESLVYKPYSMDHGMENNQMKKFEMMKMMKDMMKDNRYSDSFNKHDMMKMMKNVFGNEYSNDNYDMMKMMKEKNFEGNNYKTESYAPPQARYRYKRQVFNPQARNTEQGLDKGDRLFAKLQEQKRVHEEYVGNMTCVLKETKVLNKENKIDVKSLKQYMQQYTLPSPWFKKNFEELVDICYETAVNLPADVVEDQVIEGDFGTVNLAHVRTFMKCCKEGKRRLCMNQDTKNKIESNVGPINSILKETKLTEFQLFPLVQEMLQGEESEYLTMI